MKQKIVIKMSMPCEKSRSKAMALVAGATGVVSVGITGDGKDRLELVGHGVDTVCLVTSLRRKLGRAEILQVEEVKEKKPEDKKPAEKKPQEPKKAVETLPQFYPSYYHHQYAYPSPSHQYAYPPPSHQQQMVVCDERSTCCIM